MRRGIVKGSNDVVFNLITLMVVACVLSFIAGAAYTNVGRPIALFNATVTEKQNDTQLLPAEPEVKTVSMLDSGYSISDEHKEQDNTEPKTQDIATMENIYYCGRVSKKKSVFAALWLNSLRTG